MSNNYEYAGKPFTTAIAQEMLNRQYGKKDRIKRAGEVLLKYHLANGGLPPEGNSNLEGEVLLHNIIYAALRRLKNDGRANMIDSGMRWEVFPEGSRVLGEGNQSVYCFYDPRDREKAEAQDKSLWPCNIGSTKRDVEKRVSEQTNQWTVDPRIDLILKTPSGKDLEKKIQGILKLLDRHLKDFSGKGTEWYLVSPDEVLYLYKRVIMRFENPRLFREAFKLL